MKAMRVFSMFAFIVGICFAPALADAHCDTLGGPVVADAKEALREGDVAPVLKWVRKEDEAEIRKLFERTVAVRKKGPKARELADMYFFETLVRIHRAAEGAPYTGLKPAGAVAPSVQEADRALEGGTVEKLVHLITHAVEEGIRERYMRASETRKHAGESVEAGREFVEAYVEFTHYVERLYLDASAHETHQEGEAVTHGH